MVATSLGANGYGAAQAGASGRASLVSLNRIYNIIQMISVELTYYRYIDDLSMLVMRVTGYFVTLTRHIRMAENHRN